MSFAGVHTGAQRWAREQKSFVKTKPVGYWLLNTWKFDNYSSSMYSVGTHMARCGGQYIPHILGNLFGVIVHKLIEIG